MHFAGQYTASARARGKRALRMRTPAILRFCCAATIVAAGIVGCQSTPIEMPADPVLAQSAEIFEETVRGVLEHRCIHCHHNYAMNGGLNFQDRASVYAGTSAGLFLAPSKPHQSRIWTAMFPPMKHPDVMPGDGWGLTPAQLKAFLTWIETGAYWPEGPAGKLLIREFKVEIERYL
jgi:hypothetical protein